MALLLPYNRNITEPIGINITVGLTSKLLLMRLTLQVVLGLVFGRVMVAHILTSVLVGKAAIPMVLDYLQRE
jgi:hypothetical protein